MLVKMEVQLFKRIADLVRPPGKANTIFFQIYIKIQIYKRNQVPIWRVKVGVLKSFEIEDAKLDENISKHHWSRNKF